MGLGSPIHLSVAWLAVRRSSRDRVERRLSETNQSARPSRRREAATKPWQRLLRVVLGTRLPGVRLSSHRHLAWDGRGPCPARRDRRLPSDGVVERTAVPRSQRARCTLRSCRLNRNARSGRRHLDASGAADWHSDSDYDLIDRVAARIIRCRQPCARSRPTTFFDSRSPASPAPHGARSPANAAAPLDAQARAQRRTRRSAAAAEHSSNGSRACCPCHRNPSDTQVPHRNVQQRVRGAESADREGGATLDR